MGLLSGLTRKGKICKLCSGKGCGVCKGPAPMPPPAKRAEIDTTPRWSFSGLDIRSGVCQIETCDNRTDQRYFVKPPDEKVTYAVCGSCCEKNTGDTVARLVAAHADRERMRDNLEATPPEVLHLAKTVGRVLGPLWVWIQDEHASRPNGYNESKLMRECHQITTGKERWAGSPQQFVGFLAYEFAVLQWVFPHHIGAACEETGIITSRAARGKEMVAKFGGTCNGCGGRIDPGQQIVYLGKNDTYHQYC